MHSFKNVFHHKFKGLSKMASNICDKIAQFGRGRKKWCHFDQNSFQPTLNPRMLQIRECFNENVATSTFHCCNKSLENNQLQKRRCFVGSIFWRFMLTLCWPHCFRVREEAMHQGWMCGKGSCSLQLESNRETYVTMCPVLVCDLSPVASIPCHGFYIPNDLPSPNSNTE